MAAGPVRVAPGDFALNLIAAGRDKIVSSNSGWSKHFLQVYDESSQRVTGRLELPSLWYGLAYEPESRLLLASSGADSVYVLALDGGGLVFRRAISIPNCGVSAGLALVGTNTAIVACNQTHEVVRFEFPEGRIVARSRVGEYPYAVRPIGRNRIAVSLLGEAAVSILDAKTLATIASVSVGRHPIDMLLMPGGNALAVASSDSDSISIIDLETMREARRYRLAAPGNKLSGLQPDALAYDAESGRLWVGLASINAVAVLDGTASALRFRGIVPVGSMPSALAFSNTTRTLFIASARNASPGPSWTGTGFEFIGSRLGGGIEALSPNEQSRLGHKPIDLIGQIYGSPAVMPAAARDRIRLFTGKSNPMRHVFYVIKENRTYDQVLGDMLEGDGAPNLVLFGERVTPNHHRLARDFILFDRFFVDGWVSADGHMWSTAATSTAYVDRFWPSAYSERAAGSLEAAYDGDAEHEYPAATPGSGFLWDRAIKSGISFRNYGEWNVEDPQNPARDRNYLAGMKTRFDPHYLDAIGSVTDQARLDEFEREFREFERTDSLPRLILIHLPNDHTVGAKAGFPTPTAMVADNDLALGRLVDLISHSRYWERSVIFVVEDDAQDGPDHVDARRSPLLVISPYTRRAAAVHSPYSTASVLKTIEQILGLRSLTYFDDRAPSLLVEFSRRPDLKPYDCRPPQVDISARTPEGAPGAEESAAWDFSRPDRVPMAALNRVIWQAVKGESDKQPSIQTRIVISPARAGGQKAAGK